MNLVLPNRFHGEYSNFPADYAEVSTFRKTPSECYDQHSARDTDSPAPYATTTLVSAGSVSTPNGRRPSYRSNPHPNAAFFNHEQYQAQQQQQQLSNRSAYSDTYFNPSGHRINITENKLVNISGMTDAGYGSASTSTSTNTNAGGGGGNSATYRTSCSMPQTPLGTIRRNRLKLGRSKLRTSFGESDGNLAGCEGDNQQEQLYVKVGEVNASAGVLAVSSSDVYMNWGGGGVQQMQEPSYQQQKPQFYHQTQSKHQTQLPSIYHRPDVIVQPLVATTMPITASNTKANTSDKDMIYGPAAAAARSLIGSYRSGGGNNRFDDV